MSMKYKGREVLNFTVAIELGDLKSDDIIDILYKNNIEWYSVEQVLDDLVVVEPIEITVECVNKLFEETSKHFKSSIHILYKDFNNEGHNLEETKEILDSGLILMTY